MKRTKFDKNKERIRREIISSAIIFSQNLSGNDFMYIFDDYSYIEVFYRKSAFSHLTGVSTKLSANDFYFKAKSKKLSTSQFSLMNPTHPYDLAKKKVNRLSELPKFTTTDLVSVKNINTNTKTYKIGLTDTDLCLCLCENIDNKTGNKLDDFYIPASFRVGDDLVKKGQECHFVEFIFQKTHGHKIYSKICYGEENKISILPKEIQNKINLKAK